jgi:hypothetical protein
MTLDEARAVVIELDAEIKEAWAPDAWAMFVCTVAGHLQFSLNRPKHFPLATCDIPADAPDWLDRFKQGAREMRDAIAALRMAKEMAA